jgi:hypothetical protein
MATTRILEPQNHQEVIPHIRIPLNTPLELVANGQTIARLEFVVNPSKEERAPKITDIDISPSPNGHTPYTNRHALLEDTGTPDSPVQHTRVYRTKKKYRSPMARRIMEIELLAKLHRHSLFRALPVAEIHEMMGEDFLHRSTLNGWLHSLTERGALAVEYAGRTPSFRVTTMPLRDLPPFSGQRNA